MSLTQRRWRYLKHNLDTGTQPGLKLGIPLDLLVTVKSVPAVLETQVWSLGQEDPMEKETATHSGTLAWKIPWMEEPGRIQSMGLQRVRHDWATSLSLFTFMHWRRKWQPTPVFLPGESQGREPGGLPSMGSHRVGHDWRDLAAAAASQKVPLRQFENLRLAIKRVLKNTIVSSGWWIF